MSDLQKDGVGSGERSLGELVGEMGHDLSTLVRGEVRMAQLEVAEKAKAAGAGAGAIGAGAVLALFGLGLLLTAAVLGLGAVLPAWLSALVVAAVVFLGAAVAMLVGKRKLSQATPPLPSEAIEGAREDVETVKKGLHL